MALTLASLPLDIQNAIFEAVWNNSPYSASNLAATCRTLNQIGIPFLHRYLFIKIRTLEELSHDIKILRTTDIGNRYLRFTRHLKLIGPLQLPDEYHEHIRKYDKSRGHIWRVSRPGTFFSLEETFPRSSHQNYHENTVRIHSHPYYSWESAWKPLMTVLQTGFQHLEDFIWEADDEWTLSYPRIAPLLIPTLRRSHPACKLHLRQFCFLSLHASLTDPYELATVLSPCLHSLSIVWLVPNANDDDPDFVDSEESQRIENVNREAAMRILAMAPRLKHFAQIGVTVPYNPEQISFPGRREPHKTAAFRPDPQQTQTQKADLMSFTSFNHSMVITPLELGAWHRAIDFGNLRRWSLGLCNPEALRSLERTLTSGAGLQNLKELILRLIVQSSPREFQRAIVSFLKSLSPLTVLRIHNRINDDILETIFKSHGKSLREFEFEGIVWDLDGDYRCWEINLDAQDIAIIGKRCPNLDVLTYNYAPRENRSRVIPAQQWTRQAETGGGEYARGTSFTLMMNAEIDPDEY